MDNTIKLHYYQQEIIKSLTLTPKLRFNQLQIKGLESEHTNYHLKKLVLLKLVEKKEENYSLTDKGKDYSNLLDDQIKIVEKQPKVSIIVNAQRVNESGEIEFLMNKRLRQPYFGKVGRITGKVRYGETMKEAAERELFEETGLTATSFYLYEIYRKMRHRNEGDFVQDVLFYQFYVTGIEGSMIKKTEIQENFWATAEELNMRDDLYDDLNLEPIDTSMQLKFAESNEEVEEGF